MSEPVLLGEVLREMVAELRLKRARKTGTDRESRGRNAEQADHVVLHADTVARE